MKFVKFKNSLIVKTNNSYVFLKVNNTDDGKEVEWITVKGNHIPIKKGQSKEEAVKSFIEGKRGSGATEKSQPQGVKKLLEEYSWSGINELKMSISETKSSIKYLERDLKEAKELGWGSDSLRDIKSSIEETQKDLLEKQRQLKEIEDKMGSEKSDTYKDVPESYKKSVEHYTKEQHKKASEFYGGKMADIQRKANKENDPNVQVYRDRFEEYQNLAHYHEAMAGKEAGSGSGEKHKRRFFRSAYTPFGVDKKDKKTYFPAIESAKNDLEDKIKKQEAWLKKQEGSRYYNLYKEQIVGMKEDLKRLKEFEEEGFEYTKPNFPYVKKKKADGSTFYEARFKKNGADIIISKENEDSDYLDYHITAPNGKMLKGTKDTLQWGDMLEDSFPDYIDRLTKRGFVDKE